MDDRICAILKRHGLDFCVDEGIAFSQTENELLCTKGSQDKVEIYYMALDRKIAEATLSCCPVILKPWKDILEALSANNKYRQVACFGSEFDISDALVVCAYITNRMNSHKPENAA
ncbi:MAG TPA: hypothetical protein VJG30_00595 [Candidatus Nanoarchaeia archaeon]|nr:hypothetical protein [Candidatus Nanoarchaeia archaeon]